jgi:hypothetical protein
LETSEIAMDGKNERPCLRTGRCVGVLLGHFPICRKRRQVELSEERIRWGIKLLMRRTEVPIEILGIESNGIAFCPSQCMFRQRQLQEFGAQPNICPHFGSHDLNCSSGIRGAH